MLGRFDKESKYNINHIGILKKGLRFKSIEDIFPKGIFKDEQIVIRYKKLQKKKADCTPSKLMMNKIV